MLLRALQRKPKVSGLESAKADIGYFLGAVSTAGLRRRTIRMPADTRFDNQLQGDLRRFVLQDAFSRWQSFSEGNSERLLFPITADGAVIMAEGWKRVNQDFGNSHFEKPMQEAKRIGN